MRGQRFLLIEEAVEVYKTQILSIPSSEWNKWFTDWFVRMKKCKEWEPKHFEKQ